MNRPQRCFSELIDRLLSFVWRFLFSFALTTEQDLPTQSDLKGVALPIVLTQGFLGVQFLVVEVTICCPAFGPHFGKTNVAHLSLSGLNCYQNYHECEHVRSTRNYHF